MKAMGAIPADYEERNGELLIGGQSASALADTCDTPLFAYDFGIIQNRIDRLRHAMPSELSIHYAIKANPYDGILKNIVRIVDGLDVASMGEARAALAAGCEASAVSFAGPGKREAELQFAIEQGITLNVESANEAERAIAIGKRLGLRPQLAVRVNPDFDLRGSGMRMGGGARPFGIDASEVPAVIKRILAFDADWRGLHIFAGSQALDADAIIETQRATIELAAAISRDVGVPPPLVNLGGGFGIPYFYNELSIDIEKIGEVLKGLLANRSASLMQSRFAIELGRWVVGEAGVYLTRIVDRKVSHGAVFLVTNGGLHHQLAASGNFGTVVRRNYPIAIANRFLAEPEEEVSVVGCLCTPLDRLADQVHLPRAEIGDLVAVFMAGAYGATASPQAFLGHPAPREILLNAPIS